MAAVVVVAEIGEIGEPRFQSIFGVTFDMGM